MSAQNRSGGFDPTSVPPFPVVRLDLGEDGSVRVDGELVEGCDPSAARRLVAVRLQARGLEAVRVRASTPQGHHDMVITAQGDTHALGPDPDEDTRRSWLGRRGVALATGVATAVCLVVGAAVVVTQTAQSSAATATAAPAGVVVAEDAPGQGANLPVLAPFGFSQQAAWSVAIDPQVTPVALSGGQVGLVGEDSELVVLDTSGTVTWRGGPWTGPFTAGTFAGRPTLMGTSGTGVSMWALDADEGLPVALATPTGGQVDLDGPVPVAVLPDQTVEVLGSNGWVRRDVPVGAEAISGHSDGIVVASSEQWWLLSATGQDLGGPLPRPASATGGWSRLVAADDKHLVGVWPAGASQVVAVVDLTSGQITASLEVAQGSVTGHEDVIRNRGAQVLVVGDVFVDYSPAPRVLALEGVHAQVVGGDFVVGTREGAAVVARIAGSGVSVTEYASASEPVGHLVGITPDLAFVVARKVDTTFLYALPAVAASDREGENS